MNRYIYVRKRFQKNSLFTEFQCIIACGTHHILAELTRVAGLKTGIDPQVTLPRMDREPIYQRLDITPAIKYITFVIPVKAGHEVKL